MYRIAGIDVHKKVLAVVVVEFEGTQQAIQRRKVPYSPEQLRKLAEWFVAWEVEEVVMESTAQYWQALWHTLEVEWQPQRRQRPGAPPKAGTLHLAQAQSNRAPHGRKNDFADAERLVRRLVAEELILSFVPGPEQRLWRTLMRRRTQLMEARSTLQSQVEGFLEQAHVKLATLASDLFGVSMLRILEALGQGERDSQVLLGMVESNMKTPAEQWMDVLRPCCEWDRHYRLVIGQMVAELRLIDAQVKELENSAAELMAPYQDAVQRLAEIPGMGLVSALLVIAEIGPRAESFPSAGDLSSWVGVIPGENITAGHNYSTHSPHGNRHLRRLLNQVAHAAVKTKGSIFELKFQKFRARMPYKPAIWCVAHFICELLWMILHKGVRYEERGPGLIVQNQRKRMNRMRRHLKAHGYVVLPPNTPQPSVI
jgi:transposase